MKRNSRVLIYINIGSLSGKQLTRIMKTAKLTRNRGLLKKRGSRGNGVASTRR
jgi:hypothetical protein